MEKVLEFLRKVESFIGGLWKCEIIFPGTNQKLDFGSWKIFISTTSHLFIGFITTMISFLIIGVLWKAFIIGALTTSLMLEGKDIYKYVAKKDYTMFLQSAFDSVFYILGAAIIFLIIR